jgi:hypothetical protein
VEAEQDLSALAGAKAQEEAAEWAERQRLSAALRDALALGAPADSEAVRTLLDPYWGFGRVRQGEALRDLLPASRTPGA